MKIYRKAFLPKGFQASAVASGIKRSKKLDMALFYCQEPAKCACKFTTNKILAAPVKINKEYLKNNRQFQAVIVNSGNANCFTGEVGLRDARNTSIYIAEALGLRKESVLVASTGIIGKRLPLAKIKQAIPKLVSGLSIRGIDQAKEAILTTDAFTKEITVRFLIGSRMVTVCAVAKGAGMIAPQMATMLCFIFTDAAITQLALDTALKLAVDNSFNCITVDGCMSTNDSVILLANAKAANKTIDTGKNFNCFSRALNIVCLELAKLIVRDAEGASKFIRIEVDGAKSFAQARAVALSIANSNLFKTAVYGENPNFGRIVASVGASGIEVKEEDLKIKLGPLHKKEVDVYVNIKRGSASATVYTSDLTPEYIKINAGYN